MILTGKEITKEVKNNKIEINPFDISLVNPNSYNYRLSNKLLKVSSYQVLNPYEKTKYEEVIIPKEGYTLLPKNLYLGSTYEIIGSRYYVTSLIGRSSIGRLGMFLQITADLGQLGNAHCWTLEIEVVQPLIIYPFMRIGQVSFWIPDGTVENFYNEGYSIYDKPIISKQFNI